MHINYQIHVPSRPIQQVGRAIAIVHLTCTEEAVGINPNGNYEGGVTPTDLCVVYYRYYN